MPTTANSSTAAMPFPRREAAASYRAWSDRLQHTAGKRPACTVDVRVDDSYARRVGREHRPLAQTFDSALADATRSAR